MTRKPSQQHHRSAGPLNNNCKVYSPATLKLLRYRRILLPQHVLSTVQELHIRRHRGCRAGRRGRRRGLGSQRQFGLCTSRPNEPMYITQRTDTRVTDTHRQRVISNAVRPSLYAAEVQRDRPHRTRVSPSSSPQHLSQQPSFQPFVCPPLSSSHLSVLPALPVNPTVVPSYDRSGYSEDGLLGSPTITAPLTSPFSTCVWESCPDIHPVQSDGTESETGSSSVQSLQSAVHCDFYSTSPASILSLISHPDLPESSLFQSDTSDSNDSIQSVQSTDSDLARLRPIYHTDFKPINIGNVFSFLHFYLPTSAVVCQPNLMNCSNLQ